MSDFLVLQLLVKRDSSVHILSVSNDICGSFKYKWIVWGGKDSFLEQGHDFKNISSYTYRLQHVLFHLKDPKHKSNVCKHSVLQVDFDVFSSFFCCWESCFLHLIKKKCKTYLILNCCILRHNQDSSKRFSQSVFEGLSGAFLWWVYLNITKTLNQTQFVLPLHEYRNVLFY